MRFIALWIATVGVLIGWGGPLAAQSGCAEWRKAFRVPLPEVDVPLDIEVGPDWTCPPAETAMFEKNHNAMRDAVPVETAEALYGTWLGDDVLNQVIGRFVPGQEVLRLEPGARPDSIALRQFWMKSNVAQGIPYPWHPVDGYQGIVAEGPLVASDAPGHYRPGGERPILYGGLSLEFERGHDLLVKSRINHFERGVAFSRAGDTLVMTAEILDPLERTLSSRTMTYTRVADTAPDLAIQLVRMLEISQTLYFDCFVHQISDGAGPLIDAMAPLDAAQVAATFAPLYMVGNQLADLSVARERGVPMTAERAAEGRALLEKRIALMQDETVRGLIGRLLQSDLGCPSL